MPDTKAVDPSLVSRIVRGYVAHNTVAAGELPSLIVAVHQSLAKLGQPAEMPTPKGAVAINRSYGRDFVICLDCGWRGQVLRRHLTTAHGLSPEDYRARWSLKDTHPLTAPGYSERRSALAKQLGLGRARQPAVAPEPSAPAPKRRGRPRNPAPAHPAPAP